MDSLPSLAVANWFIRNAQAKGEKITAMKLQKLVYYAHGWCLAIYNEPLVNECVQAWQWGPVFRDIYDAAKYYGSDPITSQLSQLFESPPEIKKDDPRIDLLSKVWEVYGKYTASQLSNMTHESGGPWHLTWTKDPGRRNMDIDDELIKKEFSKKIIQTKNP